MDYNFTPMENLVVTLLCEGKGLTKIAKKLNRSHETIRGQFTNCMQKTDTHSQLELAVKILREMYDVR